MEYYPQSPDAAPPFNIFPCPMTGRVRTPINSRFIGVPLAGERGLKPQPTVLETVACQLSYSPMNFSIYILVDSEEFVNLNAVKKGSFAPAGFESLPRIRVYGSYSLR